MTAPTRAGGSYGSRGARHAYPLGAVERGVTLLSAGLDEVPMAYKDIDEVMAARSDLVPRF